MGTLFAGRYELEELAGAGGMASVYRARDLRLKRLVAVKILDDRYSDDPELVGRFSREARAVARLAHPHIVTVLDRGEAEGRQFIVFEHVDEDLKRLVCRTGPLPPGHAVQLATEIASALAFAHANGIVHRDVKPQNVLIRSGSAKVSDFGIARADDSAIENGQTATGTMLGTGDYISPEQARGERASERSDVYSLGALLFELLTGHVPFPAETGLAAAMRHASEPTPDVLAERTELPKRLGAAVTRAMAKDPQERFESMDDFRAELVACSRELPTPDLVQTMVMNEAPLPEPRAPAPAHPRRPRPRLAVLVVLPVLAALGAGLGYTLWSSGRDSSGGTKRVARAATVELKAVGAYDPPPGDGTEDSSRIAAATDGDASTFWETEHYTTVDFGNLKHGVGLVLDAGKPVRLGTIVVRTGTPGFEAMIKAGDSESGPFPDVSSSTQTVDSQTALDLHLTSARRFYVIWITSLTRVPDGSGRTPYGAQIAEVSGT